MAESLGFEPNKKGPGRWKIHPPEPDSIETASYAGAGAVAGATLGNSSPLIS